jgi:hypothetical protein
VVEAAFRYGLQAGLGWRPVADRLTAAEEAAVAEARGELLDPEWLWEPLGRRAVAGGVKLKSDAYLTERDVAGLGRIPVQTDAGRIRRLALAGPSAPDPRPAHGLPAAAGALAAVLPGEWAEAVAGVAVTANPEEQP